MRAFVGLLVVLAASVAASMASAQPVSLVADRVSIESERTLVAEGNVEVFYENRRLSASRVVYDGETEGLAIEGPVRITEADGEIVILGDSAELEPGLRDGILRSARIVLQRQLQIAADEVSIVGDRYRRLTNVVASSCRVCVRGGTPLWDIRAARVLHDTEERKIYFTRARFHVVGVPVVYIPRLRMPDPTVERMRGFLAPSFRGNGDIGQGVRVPYFVPLGPSADITVAPFITNKTRTVELRYRQEFRNGSLAVEGAISRDDLRPDDTRGYAFGAAAFRLPNDFALSLRFETVSDDDYLDEYDYSGESRLENRLSIARVRPYEFVSGAFYNYDILRPGDLSQQDRTLVNFGEAEYERVLPTRLGRLTIGADASLYDRDSSRDVLGRDVSRLGAGARWMTGGVFGPGIAVEFGAEVRADTYRVRRDPAFDANPTRVTPAAAVALRWPLSRQRGAVSELLEPVIQLAWSDVHGDDVPNEDSRVVDFDEGNLFALDRFPGRDRSETGTRLNFGLGYTRLAGAWQANAYVGRVYRFDERSQFADSTGLNGDWSDWLVSGQVVVGDRLAVTNRAVFDSSFDVARNELRLAVEAGAADLTASYLWLEAEPQEARLEDLHQAVAGIGYDFNRHWRGDLAARWDIEDERVARTDLDLTYQNECVAVDLSLSRRYYTGDNVDPTYDFGVEVSLQGFGSGDTSRYARRCPG